MSGRRGGRGRGRGGDWKQDGGSITTATPVPLAFGDDDAKNNGWDEMDGILIEEFRCNSSLAPEINDDEKAVEMLPSDDAASPHEEEDIDLLRVLAASIPQAVKTSTQTTAPEGVLSDAQAATTSRQVDAPPATESAKVTVDAKTRIGKLQKSKAGGSRALTQLSDYNSLSRSAAAAIKEKKLVGGSREEKTDNELIALAYGLSEYGTVMFRSLSHLAFQMSDVRPYDTLSSIKSRLDRLWNAGKLPFGIIKPDNAFLLDAFGVCTKKKKRSAAAISYSENENVLEENEDAAIVGSNTTNKKLRTDDDCAEKKTANSAVCEKEDSNFKLTTTPPSSPLAIDASAAAQAATTSRHSNEVDVLATESAPNAAHRARISDATAGTAVLDAEASKAESAPKATQRVRIEDATHAVVHSGKEGENKKSFRYKSRSNNKEVILKMLEEYGGYWSLHRIADSFHVCYGTAALTMQALLNEGKVKRNERSHRGRPYMYYASNWAAASGLQEKLEPSVAAQMMPTDDLSVFMPRSAASASLPLVLYPLSDDDT